MRTNNWKYFSAILGILLVFSTINLIAANSVERIYGRVVCNGKGISNVSVTDGTSVVRTDIDGSYALYPSTDAHFVYITLPSGYLTQTLRTVPQFYKKLDIKTLDNGLVELSTLEYNFELKKNPKNDINHTFIVEADVQASSAEHWDKYEVLSKDICKFIADRDDYIFTLNAGDLLWDDPYTFFERYMNIASSFGVEQFRTIGNHDMTYNVPTYEDSQKAFEQHFGPAYYSFNKGKIHYVVLNNCFYVGRGINYIGYIDNKQFEWLKEDLKYVPEHSNVVVLAHIPFRLTNKEQGFKYDANTIESQTVNFAHLEKLLSNYNVHYITGHMHTNSNIIFSDSSMEHNTAAVCGIWWKADVCADGTPAGYGVYEVKGDDISWYYKSAFKDKDYQMRLYPAGTSKEMPKSILANVWNYDSSWKVEWFENGQYKGLMKQVSIPDPYVKQIPKEDLVSWMQYVPTNHIFAAIPENPMSKIEVKVTDRFGNIYKETLKHASISSKVKNGMKYYDASEFELIGKIPSEGLQYGRLPESLRSVVRPPVWHLGECSAGLAVRFRTNSSTIRASWTALHNFHMYHMTDLNGKGLDLYCMDDDGKWKFAGSTVVRAKDNDVILITNMKEKWREYMLYLPMYDGVENLEIAINKDSSIEKPKVNSPEREKPVVFYGTSILQGGCSSRSGMAFTNYISRKINRECINLGFSGNGQLDLPIAELMAKVDASCFVLDFVPNASIAQMQERMVTFYKIIRDAHPNTPIIFVDDPIFSSSWLDKRIAKEVETKNKCFHDILDSIQMKDDNVAYMPSINMVAEDGDGSVDGIHFTDVDMIRYSEKIIPYIEDALLPNGFKYRRNLAFKNGRFRILQLTDLHWDHNSENSPLTESVIRKLCKQENPDLIVLTGDVVTRNPAREGWDDMVALFESLGKPYVMLMGNHDPEYLSRKEIYKILEKSPLHCGKRGPEKITGEGNCIIPIFESDTSDVPATLLYCFDSNHYSKGADYTYYDWIHSDQVAWYCKNSKLYTSRNSGKPIPSLAFIHIPLQEYQMINGSDKAYGEFKQKKVMSSNVNSGLFSAFLDMKDVKGVFSGHDHHYDYIGLYADIALGFGRCTGKDAQSLLSMGGRIIDIYNDVVTKDVNGGKTDSFRFETSVVLPGEKKATFYYPSGEYK